MNDQGAVILIVSVVAKWHAILQFNCMIQIGVETSLTAEMVSETLLHEIPFYFSRTFLVMEAVYEETDVRMTEEVESCCTLMDLTSSKKKRRTKGTTEHAEKPKKPRYQFTPATCKPIHLYELFSSARYFEMPISSMLKEYSVVLKLQFYLVHLQCVTTKDRCFGMFLCTEKRKKNLFWILMISRRFCGVHSPSLRHTHACNV